MALQILTIGSIALPGAKEPKGEKDHAREVQEAARQLGASIVQRGHTLLVVSDRPDAIDRYVVEGAIAAGVEGARIEVHAPMDSGGASALAKLAEQHSSIIRKTYHECQDLSIVHMNAMQDADAVILLAGSRGTIQAGLSAHLMRKAVVPIACFGGGAEVVWQHASSHRSEFFREAASDQEVDDLQRSWSNQSALNAVVLAERTREAYRKERVTRPIVLSCLGLLFGGMLGWVGFLVGPIIPPCRTDPANGISCGDWALLCLFVVVACTGLVGASIKSLRQIQRGEPVTGRTITIDGALGFAAGIVSTVLYLVAELGVNGEVKPPHTEQDYVRVGLLISVISLFAGLYLDAAFERFDALKGGVLAGETSRKKDG